VLGTTSGIAGYRAVVADPLLTPRRAVLGAAGVGAYSAAAYWSVTQRIMRAEIRLYSETVAFAGGGARELVPVGHADRVVPGTRVLARRSFTNRLVEEEQQWLEACAPWVRRRLDEGDGLLRSALLDLRVLSEGLPVSVAGWTDRWRYAWPRDVSFASAALARTGHVDLAARHLGFLQRVQRADGWFEARYDISRRRRPDDRVPQLDGTGWVVWSAAQVAAADPHGAAERLAPLRPMLVRCARRLLASIDGETALPEPSSDYWELVQDTLTLGTAAAVLAGLRCAGEVLPVVGEMALAARTARAAEVLGAAVRDRFGPGGYPRLLGGSSPDAAVAFLVPPIGPTVTDVEVLSALDRAQTSMLRPAGGLAPGEEWKNDGVSWTPQTALFASAWAASGHGGKADALLTGLGAHRTDAGSYPEKVLHDGRPAAVAPLAWTAALVVIARHEEVRTG
jgi:glucoamylase